MMHYRDRTYCAGDGCQSFSKCPKAITPEVLQGAERAGLGIARFADPSALCCYAHPDSSSPCAGGDDCRNLESNKAEHPAEPTKLCSHAPSWSDFEAFRDEEHGERNIRGTVDYTPPEPYQVRNYATDEPGHPGHPERVVIQTVEEQADDGTWVEIDPDELTETERERVFDAYNYRKSTTYDQTYS